MTALSLKNIHKSFGNVEVLKDINLEVEDGEFVVFVGPSGCGKSTLLRVIAGLEDATSGEIRIAGEQVNLTPPSKRGIAMVFQSYALYPHLNVRGNLTLALKQERQPNKFFEAQVEKYLEEKLRNAKEITLSRIKRGVQFHLVATVTVDGVNLGELLIREGFASRGTSQALSQSARSRNQASTQRIAPSNKTDKSVSQVDTEQVSYIASKSSKVFHKSTCSHAKRITPEKIVKFATKEQAMATGRRPCKTCNP